MEPCWKCGYPSCFDHGKKESMKKVSTIQIEKVVRSTWIVDSEETAQDILNSEKGNEEFKLTGSFQHVGDRVISAEIFSQETREVEFTPWDRHEK